MKWLDVAGPPGVGKSTICDPIWGPHDVTIRNDPPPVEWHDFCNEIFRLLHLVRPHPTFPAALRMNQRSIRKMATVSRYEAPGKGPYTQTGFIQRGLGFGWRMADMGQPVEELAHFFRLMPASLGAVFLEAPEDVVLQRNRNRENAAATAHENRSHMVPLMQPAIKLAKEVLDARCVPILELDTSSDTPDALRQRVRDFADTGHYHAAASRPGGKIPAVPSIPPWWG